MDNKITRKIPFAAMFLGAAMVFFGVSLAWEHGLLSHHSTITYYDAKPNSHTYTGDVFDAKSFTCAVKREEDLGKWFRFEYRGHICYCLANDIIPSGSSSDYDLTPLAFRMIGQQWRGKIKGVWVTEAP